MTKFLLLASCADGARTPVREPGTRADERVTYRNQFRYSAPACLDVPPSL
jgi:hypothetical protein